VSDAPDTEASPALGEEHVLRVRLGHGANCSSIGSLVDTMFAVATIGGAVFASVVAAMGAEPVRLVGAEAPETSEPQEPQEPREPP
jgi:hypothetical protein